MAGVIKLALLGKNIQHSVSPELHRLLFPILASRYFPELLQHEIDYQKIECDSDCDVAQWLKSAASNSFVGANVTLPYKEVASRLLPFPTHSDSDIGSLNTIRIDSREVFGTSTDGMGLLNSLWREWSSLNLSGLDWYVFGAGGAARAALFRLLEKFVPRSITIFVRSAQRAKLLLDDLDALLQLSEHGILLHVADFAAAEIRATDCAKFVLQTTPLGQKGNGGRFTPAIEWSKGDFGVDLIFIPAETEFTRTALRDGAKVIGGIGMLIEQAALSQYFWFGGRSHDDLLLRDEEYLYLKGAITNLLS